MASSMASLRDWWNGLGASERRTLTLAATALGAILLWFGVAEPLGKARDTWRQRVAQGEADLALMHRLAPQLGASGNTPTAIPDGRSLLARTDATAREAGIGDSLLRVEPGAGGQVRVWFENVSFDALMQWLETSLARGGVRIEELAVTKGGGAGKVSARLTLSEAVQ